MKPRIKLAESKTPLGGLMALYEHDGSYAINLAGQELMHSKMTASETLLGKLGVKHLQHDSPARVLIGGLGLGFTLRSVLENVGPETRVEVAELLPEVVDWNREHLRKLNGVLLQDARVQIHTVDVMELIRSAERGAYDSILLDVDNGPVALVAADNASLYTRRGIEAICHALTPGGCAVVWSAGKDAKFENRLKKSGVSFQAVPAKTHERAKRDAYMLYVLEAEL